VSSAGAKLVRVVSGRVQNVNLQIAGGAVVRFDVSDPSHNIVDLSEVPVQPGMLPLNGSSFAIGVFCGYAYIPATLISTTATDRIYQAVVPANSAFRVYVATTLHVTDGTGNAVDTMKPGAPVGVGGRTTITIALAIQ
jgi:hypothetical protein